MKSNLTAAEIGAQAEDRAEAHLIAHGFSILARNYRVRGAEIDLIAKEGDCIAFIEVKYRKHPGASAREAVTPAKRRRIVMAAEKFLQQHGLWESPVRFDIIEVFPDSIAHLRAAFDATAMQGNPSQNRCN